MAVGSLGEFAGRIDEVRQTHNDETPRCERIQERVEDSNVRIPKRIGVPELGG